VCDVWERSEVGAMWDVGATRLVLQRGHTSHTPGFSPSPLKSNTQARHNYTPPAAAPGARPHPSGTRTAIAALHSARRPRPPGLLALKLLAPALLQPQGNVYRPGTRKQARTHVGDVAAVRDVTNARQRHLSSAARIRWGVGRVVRTSVAGQGERERGREGGTTQPAHTQPLSSLFPSSFHHFFFHHCFCQAKPWAAHGHCHCHCATHPPAV
jgi:hypothetical protein